MLNCSFMENCFISSFCISEVTNDVMALKHSTNLIYSCNQFHGTAAKGAFSQNKELCVETFKHTHLDY